MAPMRRGDREKHPWPTSFDFSRRRSTRSSRSSSTSTWARGRRSRKSTTASATCGRPSRKSSELAMRFAVAVLIGVVVSLGAGLAQHPAAGTGAPPAAVIKPVADGVHIFEYRGYQSMFVVDPAGVLVSDPMNPEATKVFLAGVRN